MTRGLLVTGMLAILLCAGWLLWRGHRDPPAGDDGHIRIVPAGGKAAVAHPSPLSKPARVPPGGEPETALPDLKPLSVNERAAMLDGRSREPVWAGRTESELTRQLAGAMRGLAIQSARCADRLCAVESQLQSFGDHQAEVAQLVLPDEIVISRLVTALENGVAVGLPVKEGAAPIFDREWCPEEDFTNGTKNGGFLRLSKRASGRLY
ncbi:hypothetical protein [Sphingomonas sp. Leaf231]|uniref:hypothetical protein n=1 Tax=Sphingomonas sp. Leaf231 TaxID=1736301 RepID=UPI000A69F7FC|nr:hypothetical protein [Sphingomonas sp. Leaf231]